MNNEKNCHNCLNRCMDMDMDPYCAADEVLRKHPYGLVLARNSPAKLGCLKDGVYTFWKEDIRGRKIDDELTAYKTLENTITHLRVLRIKRDENKTKVDAAFTELVMLAEELSKLTPPEAWADQNADGVWARYRVNILGTPLLHCGVAQVLLDGGPFHLEFGERCHASYQRWRSAAEALTKAAGEYEVAFKKAIEV